MAENSTVGQGDHRVLGLGQVQLTRRPHVLAYPQTTNQSEACFVLEDTLRGKYFRLGAVEYSFFVKLDGQRTIRQIVAELASEYGSEALNEQEAFGIGRWFVEQELAESRASRSAGQQWKCRQQWLGRRWLGWNPLFVKTRLGNPDDWLTRMDPLGRGIFTWPCFAVWLCVVLAALVRVSLQQERLSRDSVGILAPQNWLLLLTVWVVLKVIHETSHGLACKRFGVPVRECGVMWVMFSPMAYVDATAAWRLPDKWQRIVVSLAGMYAEGFVAAVAACIWSYLDVGTAAHVCYQIMVAAGISTLIFNANPFMRFDGYFVLSDWWEVPNLSVLAQRYSGYLFRKYLLGARVSPPSMPPRKAVGIKLYSLIAWWWRIAMMLGIIIAAQRLFWGAGVLLAIGTTALWLGVPFIRWSLLVWEGKEKIPSPVRLVASVAVAVSVAWVVYAWLPWPAGVSAPALIEGHQDVVVRTRTPGFVREVLVENDQAVLAGQVLFKLENRELEQEGVDLRLQIQQVGSRRSDFLEQADHAAEQSQRRFQEALQKRLNERQNELQELVVRAPQDGRVLAPLLDERLGTFVKSGTEVLRICGPEKQVRISVHQDDLEHFRAMVGKEVRVATRSGASLGARLTEVQPHATAQVPDVALTAIAGGPLPVQPRARTEKSSSDASGAEYDLLTPRFVAIAQLLPETNPPPHGMLASVSFFTADETVGRHVIRWLQVWIDQRVGR
ncbi:MAG: HlyD family efflux transporter periplasmic adaptor subunit [Planctomycetota bacterium]|nr:HlyD family efflux transporter periplasmic adaptor subunit [Planctomycetota bacterium]